MRRFSRHLPVSPPVQRLGWRTGFVLAGLAVLVIAVLFHAPWFRVFAVGLVAFSCLESIRERKRLKGLKASRTGTICSFRRGFDCRKVDPWIIRATYQEAQNWIPGFPLEAGDDIREQLKIADEDLCYLAQDIANRSGHDLTHTGDNPWFDRVKTAGDLVLFINHQPKIRLA